MMDDEHLGDICKACKRLGADSLPSADNCQNYLIDMTSTPSQILFKLQAGTMYFTMGCDMDGGDPSECTATIS